MTDDSVANGPARTVYAHRQAVHAAQQQRLADRSRTIAYLRVATFLGGAALLVGAVTAAHPRSEWLSAAGAMLLLVFGALVTYHAGVERRERRHEALRRINEIALAKLARDWARVPVSPATAPPSHAYAEDLDLFGRASLFALLWSGGTEMGRTRLADWVLQPAAPEQVRARQGAIDEMAPLIDLRQEVLAAAHVGALESHQATRFVEWAEERPWLSVCPVAVWAIRGLTAAILSLIVLQVAGVVHEMFWILPAAVAFIVSNLLAAKVEHVFDRAFAQHAVFRHYAKLFRLVSSVPFGSPLLRDLQAALVTDHHTADRQMARLHHLMELADLRRSALVHLPVQILTLWDFHVVLLVERWQCRAGRAVRRWFDTLATFEALAALAALRFDNPSWAFAQVAAEAGEDVLDATQLGHPLLAPGVRVDNDVRIGPPGTFLLVTGSNMSGKSTLLRAVGVNVVLAQAGAPVCAARMRLPPVRLYTSIRVQDSLEQGVSFFMAAVKRLKQVVEAAGQGPPMLLYLLDEVLQGTNTAERQIAVRSILRHLLQRPAFGAVTTHDLMLAATPDLAAAVQAVHFTEHLEPSGAGASMTFDYRLRPGLATSHNALKLMEMMGLAVDDPDPGARS